MAGIRKKIGEILIEEKLITEEQLSEALETQRLTGQKVGQILIDKGFIKESVLYKVLADKLGCKYVDLENYEINGNVVTKISQTLAQKHKAVPIDIENNKLKVAMSEPTNIIAIDDIMLYRNEVINNVIRILDMDKEYNAYKELKSVHSIIDVDVDLITIRKYVGINKSKEVFKEIESLILNNKLNNNRIDIINYLKGRKYEWFKKYI